jgi:hypothetical protein
MSHPPGRPPLGKVAMTATERVRRWAVKYAGKEPDEAPEARIRQLEARMEARNRELEAELARAAKFGNGAPVPKSNTALEAHIRELEAELARERAKPMGVDFTQAPKTWRQKFESFQRQYARQKDREVEQRVQDRIEQWMEKMRPHLENARHITEGRKGLISKGESTKLKRCLHPDNSASTDMRHQAFIIWQRIEHLLLSEQDAPTVINFTMRRKKKA